MCVFQGERGRDGTPGFAGLQGPPVSNRNCNHMTNNQHLTEQHAVQLLPLYCENIVKSIKTSRKSVLFLY